MFGMHKGHGGHRGGGRGGDAMGKGRERMFAQGDIKLLVLSLLQQQPRHGYEVIKAIEELAGGDYSPSPGVIYPTLTLLEEVGQAQAIADTNGKKLYSVTAEGQSVLDQSQAVLERIRQRLSAAGSIAAARRTPELHRAMQNFKTALHLRLERDDLSTETLRKIADAIDRAAVEIERS